jgi:ribosomal protein S12 methylthiotransferase
MEAQQAIALDWSQRQVGKQLEVIIDGADPDFANLVLGRTHADAPDIDCLVRVKGKSLQPGDLATVKVTAADGYDLIARPIGSPR